MAYDVNLPVFEGPFDLLLHLVKVNEMDVFDVNVAEITDQYLKTLEEMEELDLEIAGEFLVMASTLISLKVKSLLPDLPGEEDEDEGEDISEIMSAKALMEQLIEYRRFKELSVELSERQEEQLRMYYRNSLLPALEQDEQDGPMRSETSLLFDCFARVLRYVESLPHHDIAFEPFSVEQRMSALRSRLVDSSSLELFTLFRDCRNKADMIVTFLSLLELSRLREIRIEQGTPYQEVFVYRRDPKDDAEPPVEPDEAPQSSDETQEDAPTTGPEAYIPTPKDNSPDASQS
jgi:segregation and condensation protein A